MFMMFLVLNTVVFLFLFLTLLWLLWQWRFSFNYMREKGSSFECGFDPKDKARLPFSMRFFSLLMLFLIFDVELVFLLQLPLLLLGSLKAFFCYAFFMWFLVMGLVEEWRRSMLDWKF